MDFLKRSNLLSFLVIGTIFVTKLTVHAAPWDSLEELEQRDSIEFFNDISTNSSDFVSDADLIKQLNVTAEFLEELKINLLKAIAEERVSYQDRLRQEFGGGNGGINELFGVGGGAGGTGGFGPNNNQEEEDDEEEGPTVAGPGPFGVLSGLFGIFSGIGTLNPMRVLQSTVNFFPPDSRAQAQTALDMYFGNQIGNVTATSLPPLTDAPTNVKVTPVPIPVKVTTAKAKYMVKPKVVPMVDQAIANINAPLDEETAELVNKKVILVSLEKDFSDSGDKLKVEEVTEGTTQRMKTDFEKEYEAVEKLKTGIL